MNAMEAALIAIQFCAGAGFMYVVVRYRVALRFLTRDLLEAHRLLVKAMKILRDRDDFDSRYAWHEMDEYMQRHSPLRGPQRRDQQ